MIEIDNINNYWIQTYSSKRFNVLHPRPEDILLRDIVHSLSMICRFNGHISGSIPYTVAQHCVLVSDICGEELKLCGLMHDFSEAYIMDISAPIKRMPMFDEYRKMEANIQNMIYEKFGWKGPEHPDVKKADLILLATEARDLMSPLHPDWKLTVTPLPFKIVPLNSGDAEALLLERMKKLLGETKFNQFMEER